MCFSPQADVLVGLTVTGIGVDAVLHARNRSERAMAAVPLVLGAHLLTEVQVWRGLQDGLAPSAWRPALYAYLLVAFVVVPVLVPVAVAGMDPTATRVRSGAFIAVGVGVAAVLLHAIAVGPVGARIVGHHVAYRTGLLGGGVVVALYVLATCGPLLAARDRTIRWYGLANLIAVGALALIAKTALISLWCAWAAVISVAIAAHLRAPIVWAPRRRVSDGS
ncbi:DUF6629 family protein [Aquihabitans sp. McL0605]|uniref:DUF6629 family protein n=1 Tax=Aquihabitans sp. McL0605 TaxID=3415671 RepID=UPI003CE716B4